MTKTYCDCCKDEITTQNSMQGMQAAKVTWKVGIGSRVDVNFVAEIASPSTFPENCHICRYCVLDAFARTDDRPRCVEERAK